MATTRRTNRDEPPRYGGHYRRLSDTPLGHGGQGTVYKCQHTFTQQIVAIKEVDIQSTEALARLRREAEALAQATHPNIARILFAGVEGDTAYLVMEYIEGPSLQQRLDEGRLSSVDEIIALGQALTEALGHLHQHGWLHRDLKPDNVLFRPDGTPVLVDFGIAHHMERSRLTKVGEVFGTLEYASPEHLDGYPLDAQSDLYSLGVLLYVCCTGTLPFGDAGETKSEQARFIVRVTTKEAADVRQHRSDCPDALAALLAALLARRSEERPTHATAVYQQLANIGATPATTHTADLPPRPSSAFPRPGSPALYIPQQPKPLSTWTNEIGMTFVRIPAGMFMMGSNNGYANEQPVHEVTISKPFDLQTTPVTQKQWKAVMAKVVKEKTWPRNTYYGKPSSFSKGINARLRPVDKVSWHEAKLFLEHLNQSEDGGYRLPTEAEWEYACRAGSETRYHFGNDEQDLGKYAWYNANSGSQTHPVATKKPNAWGLYDMHGNVWEWVEDWYASGYYSTSPRTDPSGPDSGTSRVLRGGSWNSFPDFLCAASRNANTPLVHEYYNGFRVAKTR